MTSLVSIILITFRLNRAFAMLLNREIENPFPISVVDALIRSAHFACQGVFCLLYVFLRNLWVNFGII